MVGKVEEGENNSHHLDGEWKEALGKGWMDGWMDIWMNGWMTEVASTPEFLQSSSKITRDQPGDWFMCKNH